MESALDVYRYVAERQSDTPDDGNNGEGNNGGGNGGGNNGGGNNGGGGSGSGPAAGVAKAGAPLVTKLTPNTGPPSGGTRVLISGTAFASAVRVFFGNHEVTTACPPAGGTGAAPCFSKVSDTELVAYNPARPPGQVHVVVGNAVGNSVTTAADLFTYAELKRSAPPAVSRAVAQPQSNTSKAVQPATPGGTGQAPVSVSSPVFVTTAVPVSVPGTATAPGAAAMKEEAPDLAPQRSFNMVSSAADASALAGFAIMGAFLLYGCARSLRRGGFSGACAENPEPQAAAATAELR